ncbi:MAG: hypothetical protein RLZZ450_5847 [Pseudomonadota bacterium]
MRSLTFVPALFLTSLLAGPLACGGAAPRETAHVVRNKEPLTRPPPSESLSVSGLRGTLSPFEIEGALKPRLPKFLRCAQQRLGAVEVLAGSITLSFHVATNGAVPGVSPIASSLGDRETERCMLEVSQSTRFPPPHGGEADFTWPLELPGDPDVRAPVALGADAARSAVGARSGEVTAGEALHASCGGGQMLVTAYLDTSGSVLAVGVATPDLATPTELDCIAAGVRSWVFASPGSYLGKVSFTLPL